MSGHMEILEKIMDLSLDRLSKIDKDSDVELYTLERHIYLHARFFYDLMVIKIKDDK